MLEKYFFFSSKAELLKIFFAPNHFLKSGCVYIEELNLIMITNEQVLNSIFDTLALGSAEEISIDSMKVSGAFTITVRATRDHGFEGEYSAFFN